MDQHTASALELIAEANKALNGVKDMLDQADRCLGLGLQYECEHGTLATADTWQTARDELNDIIDRIPELQDMNSDVRALIEIVEESRDDEAVAQLQHKLAFSGAGGLH
jgi:argonaute-like protein implicated in RNA metabolism and viral defense